MEKVELKIEPKNGEVIIRTGSAPEIQSPVPIVIDGQISAPRVFYEARKDFEGARVSTIIDGPAFSPGNTHVIVNRNTRMIILRQGDQNAYSNQISGSLKISKEFKELDINGTTGRRTQELAKLLRRYLFLFLDREAGMKLISDLMNFKGSVNANVQDAKDTRGNRKNAIEVSVTSNIPVNFEISLPFFYGHPTVRIWVDIVLEANGTNLDCFLQSDYAYEYFETAANRIIDDEIKPFYEAGFAVIEV